jgi:hypothetical protein
MQRAIIFIGVFGLCFFISLYGCSPFIIHQLMSYGMHEGIILRDLFFLQLGVAIAMSICGILWMFVLPRELYKYKKRIIALYFSPFVLGICLFVWITFL